MELPQIRITRRRGDIEERIEIGVPAGELFTSQLDAFSEGQRIGAELILEANANEASRRLEWSPTLCDGERVGYAAAEKACQALGDGWRLPTRQELESILDLSRHEPAVDPERFPGTKSGAYWTSTPCAWSSDFAWIVNFSYGNVYDFHRDYYDAFVRAVRSVPAGQ